MMLNQTEFEDFVTYFQEQQRNNIQKQLLASLSIDDVSEKDIGEEEFDIKKVIKEISEKTTLTMNKILLQANFIIQNNVQNTIKQISQFQQIISSKYSQNTINKQIMKKKTTNSEQKYYTNSNPSKNKETIFQNTLSAYIQKQIQQNHNHWKNKLKYSKQMNNNLIKQRKQKQLSLQLFKRQYVRQKNCLSLIYNLASHNRLQKQNKRINLGLYEYEDEQCEMLLKKMK